MKKTIFVIWHALKIMNWSQVLLCGSVRLWRQFINSDGQQLHWHQQSEQLPVTLAHWTLKKTTYDVGNPGPGLGQAQKCGGVRPVNEIPWQYGRIVDNLYTEYHSLILSIRYRLTPRQG